MNIVDVRERMFDNKNMLDIFEDVLKICKEYNYHPDVFLVTKEMFDKAVDEMKQNSLCSSVKAIDFDNFFGAKTEGEWAEFIHELTLFKGIRLEIPTTPYEIAYCEEKRKLLTKKSDLEIELQKINKALSKF